MTASAVVDRSTVQVRITIDTSGVGTRRAMPSILPFTCGMTSDVALAAPVVVGMIESAAARARRRSLCGKSRICWSLVYECTVVMKPLTKPKFSMTTFTTGTRQFVVQLALEMMACLAASYDS